MRIIAILAFVLFYSFVHGQAVNRQQVIVETTSLAEMYEFDDSQKLELQKVIEHKYRELNNIERFREDPKAYRDKRKDIYKHLESSIEGLMTPVQKEAYQAQKSKNKAKSVQSSSAKHNQKKKNSNQLKSSSKKGIGN